MIKGNLRIEVDKSILLRQARNEFARELFSLVDKNRYYLREWLPWLDQNKSVSNSADFINNTLKSAAEGSSLTLLIFYQLNIVGVIGFNKIDKSNKGAEIGYWLAHEYGGKGIMTKACKALTEYGFSTLNLNRIEIKCAPSNKPSCAIPLRLKFEYEGLLRQYQWLYDHYVDASIYSMLKEEWNIKKAAL